MTEITAPTHCPDCAAEVHSFTEEKSQITTHWCENAECPGRIADMLVFVADRTILEIEGLGPETAAALAKQRYVVTLADLFEFCRDARVALDRVGEERFKEGMQRRGLPGAATIKMIETVERAKTASWERWIAALGIPMIGLSLGKTLARELKFDTEMFACLPQALYLAPEIQIEGIGFHKREELRRTVYSYRFVSLCRRLYNVGVRPTPIEQPVVTEGAPLSTMVFCITGEFYGLGSRDFLTKKLVELGATAKSGVSKKLTHLLVGSEPGSTKLKKAAELKLKQMEEGELTDLLAKHGVKTSAGMDMEWA